MELLILKNVNGKSAGVKSAGLVINACAQVCLRAGPKFGLRRTTAGKFGPRFGAARQRFTIRPNFGNIRCRFLRFSSY